MSFPICIGIAVEPDGARLVTRRNGQEQSIRHFSGKGGWAALESHVASLQGPVRLALGAGALGLALVLSGQPRREIVLVSAAIAVQPAALALYAERAL